MSLVGPRPIVTAEIVKYGPYYGLYTMVTPGITGLWQISGRNNTTYDERVQLDAYYVRNWSPWLDMYLLDPHDSHRAVRRRRVLMRGIAVERRTSRSDCSGLHRQAASPAVPRLPPARRSQHWIASRIEERAQQGAFLDHRRIHEGQ